MMKLLLGAACALAFGLSAQAQDWSQPADFDGLVSALEKMSEDGLNAEDYGLSALRTLPSGPVRDVAATKAWTQAARHMLNGRVDTRTVEPDWTASKRTADLTALLNTALAADTVGESLSRLAPKQPVYTALKSELAAMRAAQREEGVKVELGPALKRGMSGTRVSALQTRLVQEGLLTDATGTFDEMTETAVKLYQDRQELDADGVAGAATIGAINRGVQSRIDALRVNLERLRWLPDDLGRRHVRVNIAEFKVTAWNAGRIERTHLGIVGKPYRKTPVFSDAFQYMVFNPWWETPRSLTLRDKLPTFQRDPGAAKRLGFQVLDSSGKALPIETINWNNYSASDFPYRIRQSPGETNALGQVKMMFPNRHAVYLHDTPTRGLFAQRQRAFSSGCIRTQDPLDLSEWLLSETPGWDRARIDEAIASGKETRANLAERVPVHILYMTSVVGADGGVRYLDDVYDRDAKVLAGLKTRL